jgi:hypothetical protein
MGWYKAGVLQFQFQGTLQFNRLRDDPIKAAGEMACSQCMTSALGKGHA